MKSTSKPSASERNPLCQSIAGVTCEYRQGRGVELIITGSEEETMRVLPLDLGGGLSEANGIVNDCRRHSREDGFSFSFESTTIIPFGVEPEIKREIEFAGNHAAVTVDLQLKGGLAVKSLQLDPVIISGPFERIGIISYPDESGVIGKIKWRSPSEGTEECLYRSARPFLCCVAETKSGQRWEIGCGDDLWRWQCAGKYQADSEFRIIRRDNELRIEREVYRHRDENTIAPERNLRFRWYFAWDSGKRPLRRKAAPATVVELSDALPETKALKTTGFTWNGTLHPKAVYMPTPETSGNAVCALAHPVVKRYKNWVRSAAAKYVSASVRITEVSAHFCSCAGHLERNNKPQLSHWDMMAVFELWNWGNRQLMKKDNQLVFLPEADSPFRVLPSIGGLAQPPELLE